MSPHTLPLDPPRRRTESRRPTTVFFSVGEPSGDLHAANLIRAIQRENPHARCLGLGGPRMGQAGCEVLHNLSRHAVMWVGSVVAQLPRFLTLLKQTRLWFDQYHPDVVVLVDYPGFNWHVAALAKAKGIPVVYYGIPQLWAWAPWRVDKLRRTVDQVLCQLPFETGWLRQRGVPAEFVGHPYFDELLQRHLDAAFLEGMRVDRRALLTLLPGSRRQEVVTTGPWMLQTVRALIDRGVACRVVSACFNSEQANQMQVLARHYRVPIEVYCQRTPELIEAATCCLACSGSVSLELLYHRKPSVMLYRVGRVGYWLQDVFRTSRYISLPNLLATSDISRRPWQRLTEDEQDALPFPEYLGTSGCAPQVVDRLEGWLHDPARRQDKLDQLEALAGQFVRAGASQQSAARILQIAERKSSVDSLHGMVPATGKGGPKEDTRSGDAAGPHRDGDPPRI